MRRRCVLWCGVPAALLAAGVTLLLALSGGEAPGDDFNRIERAPLVRPDIGGVTVPPNMAPLNFLIEEDGSSFFVKMRSGQGPTLEVSSTTGRISIPRTPWSRLLDMNRGRELHVNVFVKDRGGRWNGFKTITLGIAPDDIDGFVAYRNMHPARSSWTMSINCRDLRNDNESEILRYNSGFEAVCVNCHTPLSNRPDRMLIGIRSKRSGPSTLLVEDGVPRKIGAQFGYSSWHPSGRLVAYSVNDLPVFFHSARKEIHDTADRDSYIAYYLVDNNLTKTCPRISRKERLENWPTWSPDGRHLYFCAAPKLWTDPAESPPKRYQEVKYDLERISYDLEGDRWGQVETVLSSADTGKSVGMPRISPDGRWLSFCMFDHGFFPNWREESDLYLIDLEAARKGGKYEYRRLDINSERSESWHSWSSNSRWIVFSSKRDYGIFTRLYFSYVDGTGRAHKPFLLPQEDPAFYDSCLYAYNTPAFLTKPVPFNRGSLEEVVRSPDKVTVDATTMPTPKAGPSRRAPGEGE